MVNSLLRCPVTTVPLPLSNKAGKAWMLQILIEQRSKPTVLKDRKGGSMDKFICKSCGGRYLDVVPTHTINAAQEHDIVFYCANCGIDAYKEHYGKISAEEAEEKIVDLINRLLEAGYFNEDDFKIVDDDPNDDPNDDLEDASLEKQVH